MISGRVTMLHGMSAEAPSTAVDTWTGIEAPEVRQGLAARALTRPWPLAVWGAMLAWTAALFIAARSDYYGFRYARFDLGNMTQAVWSTAHGRPLETTLLSGEQSSRLASHVDPILALLAPAWLVWPSPLMLAFVQIAACAAGALPVFWLARKHLGSERAGGLMALAYLAYPWLVWTALDAMHPVTLAIPLFLYAIWFLDERKLARFWVCALLILMTGELMGITLAALGLWYWLSRRERSAGLAIALVGFAWSLVAVKLIVPLYHGAESPFTAYYASVGGSPEGVLRTLFTDPGAIASNLFTSNDLGYLVWLSAPLAGLYVLSPGLALVALPQMAANALSDSPATVGPQHQYIAAIIPFLITATVLGIARLSPRRRNFAAILVLTLSAMLLGYAGPWRGAPAAVDLWYQAPVSDERADALDEAVALVPVDASVSATNKAGSHLSGRRYIFSVPDVLSADWVVLDMQDPWLAAAEEALVPGSHPDLLRSLRERLDSSAEWRLVFDRGGVVVFKRATAAR